MLSDWGWDSTWAAALAATRPDRDDRPGRVSGQERDRWTVQLDDGPVVARITGQLTGPWPVTGDWITVRAEPSTTDPVAIVAVLSRRSAVSRGAAGDGTTGQVLASNVDVIWIVHGLDTPPNLRRIERYLAAALASGAVPEIVLTKADLSAEVAAAAAAVDTVAMGVTAGRPIFGQDASKSRQYGRQFTNFWVWINTLSFAVGYAMCGFRLYPLAAVDRLCRTVAISRRMDFDIDIVVRLYWQGVRVINVPTRVRYPVDGVSHFRLGRDNLMISKIHARLFFGMLARLPQLLLRHWQ